MAPDIIDYIVAGEGRDMLLKMKYKYYQTTKSEAINLSNKGQAVAVSLPINSSWYYNKYTKDIEHTNNYHYMVLEGTILHNDITYCKFANSWGKGYLYVPKSYYDKYARDLWTLAHK